MITSKITPRPFQRQLLDELSWSPAVGIFSKTGSGKTIMALQRFVEGPTDNLLVIVPSHVVRQWRNVIEKNLEGFTMCEYKNWWTAKRFNTELKKAHKKGSKGNIIVAKLQSAHSYTHLLEIVDSNWTVIIDESHRIKSPERKRRKNPWSGENVISYNNRVETAFLLGGLTPWKMILTATPTQGRKGGYIDLYTQLRFLGVLDMTLDQFERRYCIKRNMNIPGVPFPIATVVDYTKQKEELDQLLKVYTRSYSPKYTEDEPLFEKVTIEKTPTYAKAVKDKGYKDLDLGSSSRTRIFSRRLTGGLVTGVTFFEEEKKYLDNTLKIDWLEEFLQDTDETVMIVYTLNTELELLESLMKRLGRTYITLNGATKDKDIEIAREDYSVILGQIKACGESIDNLQYKTHIMVMYSLPDSSLDYRQVIGRIHRDGSVYAPIYYFLVMEGTIDDHIYKMIEDKVEYTSDMIDRIALEEFE